jgi:hypothetical protein
MKTAQTRRKKGLRPIPLQQQVHYQAQEQVERDSLLL